MCRLASIIRIRFRISGKGYSSGGRISTTIPIDFDLDGGIRGEPGKTVYGTVIMAVIL